MYIDIVLLYFILNAMSFLNAMFSAKIKKKIQYAAYCQ